MIGQRYPEEDALRVWEEDGLTLSILRVKRGHLCGYVRFPSRPVRESGYRGILSFVPVHGGITYASEDDDGSMVYGFDCSHSGDWSSYDTSGKNWTEGEVEVGTRNMASGIRHAVAFEDRYLLACDGEERAAVLDEYTEAHGIPFDVTDNFGAMIVLGGLASFAVERLSVGDWPA